MERLAAVRGGLGCLRRPGVLGPAACRCWSGRRFQRSKSDAATTTPTTPTKPYYVTTPIFYVNADPHVGHMYSLVLADVLKRWQQLLGGPARRVLLCTGTDEHGLKVQQAAARAGVAPKPFCDESAAVFADLARRASIDADFFIRTTDADHAAAVRAVWRRLWRRGYVYQAKHAGWYCVSDETFYPAALVEKRLAPATGKAEMVSTETGKTVEWTEERNYHFRMTAVRDRLLRFYAARPDFVVPAARMAEVVDWVTHHLEDLSISRPASRLAWGVPVPGDASQTIYVWVDALVNYLTKAGYPERWAPEEAAEVALAAAAGAAEEGLGGRLAGEERVLPEQQQQQQQQMTPPPAVLTPEQKARQEGGGWPADVHVLGKDIVRFHAVYWPALLLALDLPLPRRLLSHAHWTLGRKKMSKSVGNVVNPFYAMDRFGVDAMRYYLVHDGGIEHDADYGNEHIVERYKKGLQGGLGNLLGRVTRTSRWSVRAAVVAHCAQTLSVSGAGEKEQHGPDLDAQRAALAAVADVVAAEMERLDPRAALHAVMHVVYRTNRFLQDTAPWTLAKELEAVPAGDAARIAALRTRLDDVVFLAAEALRVAGILLQPVMPSKAAETLDVLGVDPSRRTFAFAQLGADEFYGEPLQPPGRSKDGGLFPPLPVED